MLNSELCGGSAESNHVLNFIERHGGPMTSEYSLGSSGDTTFSYSGTSAASNADVGTHEALADLEAWRVDFQRLTAAVASGQQLPVSEEMLELAEQVSNSIGEPDHVRRWAERLASEALLIDDDNR